VVARLRLGALLVAGLSACEPGSSDSLVARAGEYEFTVAEAVDLLAPRGSLPNQAGVVRTLAELWIDYTLLADASLEDSSYAGIRIDELVRDQLESEMVFALRDSVIRPDTLTEAELRTLFAEEGPGVRLRARHILLGYPDQASPAQRDSVRALLGQIRDRIESGESFETLARTYSQDRVSGAQGGDLGFFGRGEMVAPFEEAAFSLELGELSPIVETPFGAHLILVDDRQVPTYEDERAQFRIQMLATRMAEAESVYVATMEGQAELRIEEGAADLVREVAREPWNRLSSRAANRALVRYAGGSVTVSDVQFFLQTRGPQYRDQAINAPDEAIDDNLLRPLAQRNLFVQAARDSGFAPDPSVEDSLRAEARRGIGQAAGALGFRGVAPPGDLNREEAVDRMVLTTLEQILADEREVVALGPVGFALRRTHRTEIFDSGVEAAVRRIESIRGAVPPYVPPGDTGGTLGGAGTPQPSDTSGTGSG
jgi:peptidyl-prolyl cis-trans isomerase D